MKQLVIIDKLKEAIGDDKVIAALFYTFNFDPAFFEQHILPAFLPDVPFTNNEIQNNILWRQYVGELPPVTVYYDFHAKDSSRGPTLSYEVRAIDMKTKKTGKACFHPKVSFVLLKDSLILIAGSNNMSPGGWSHNKEVFTVIRLNKSDYPYELKSDLWEFLYQTSLMYSDEYTEAEERVESFFRKKNHPSSEKIVFYYNHKKNFRNLLEQLIKRNHDQRFDRIEIISPYISDSPLFVDKLTEYANPETVFLALPYRGVSEVAITEECFDLYKEKHIAWSEFVRPDNDTFNRFNHSKVYRLNGKYKCFTVFGSVNFTNKAWESVSGGGNLETALVIEENRHNFKDWLRPNSNNKLTFQSEQHDETSRDIRHDVPDISFIIDWAEKQLLYHLKEKDFTGKVQLNFNKNKMLIAGKNHINLDPESLQFLGDNPLIKVTVKGDEFYYYPNQTGIEYKPLSSKYQLSDKEILELWDKISDKKDGFTELTRLKERFILSRLDREGNWNDDHETISKSTMNLMAAHLSAMIKLEGKLFVVPNLIRDYNKKLKQLTYYLFAENLDTLPSYLTLLGKMNEEDQLNDGVYWFVLELLLLNFYDRKKMSIIIKKLRGIPGESKWRADFVVKEIRKKQKYLEKKMGREGVDKKLFNWITQEIKTER